MGTRSRQACPLRVDWVQTVINVWQESIVTNDRDAAQLLHGAKQLLINLPPPETPLEALLLRGFIAESLLLRLDRLGLVPLPCARVLHAASSGGFGEAPEVPADCVHPKVALAVAWIATSCDRPDLRLRHVATAVQMSPWYLSRLLKRDTGIGFARQLRHARLCRGALLLESSTQSIKEIAAAAGYTWARDFSKEFAKAFGTPPSVWRRLNAIGLIRKTPTF
jgi:AraC-like DNA-binding protein